MTLCASFRALALQAKAGMRPACDYLYSILRASIPGPWQHSAQSAGNKAVAGRTQFIPET
jgi:hypothetical protein